jgi:hypothetical protein
MATAPPLRIWLYGLLLAVAVMALLIPLRQMVERKTGEALAGEVQQYLSAPRPRGQGHVRVLALGSSLLRAATPSVNYQSLHGVEWLRLTKSYVGFGYLGNVLDSIDKQPPDVLVIDTNLLLPTETLVDDLRDTLALAPIHAGYALMEQAGWGAPWSKRVLQQQEAPYVCAPLAADRLYQQRTMLIPQQRAELAKAAVDPAVSGTLLRLSRQGVRIVLLDLRRSTQFEHDLNGDRQRWLQRWQSVLPPGGTIGYLTSPDFNDASLYCDGRHMNEAGARRFARWWRHQLEQMGKEN